MKFRDSIRLSDSMGIKLSIILVILLVGINGVFIYSKLGDLKKSKEQAAYIDEFRFQLDEILKVVQRSDLGLRGYFIYQDRQTLLDPHLLAKEDFVENNKALLSLFQQSNLDNSRLLVVMGKVKAYLDLNDLLIEKIRQGDFAYVVEEEKKDPGYYVWLEYSEFIPEVEAFLTELDKKTELDYQNDMIKLIILQVLILIMGIPALLTILQRIIAASQKRAELFSSIDRSTKKYVFDDEQAIDGSQEGKIIDVLQKNLAEASEFVKEIANRNYNVQWSGLTDNLRDSNQQNLAGNLVKMRNQMKEVKIKDDQHLWSVNGLAKFSDIIRTNMNDLSLFADRIVSELVKYVDANQAALFVVNDDIELLELKGCFAYDRKKFVDQGIEKGQGLAGQVWVEKQMIVLKEVPADYITITSGLGEATPTFLIIVPLLAEERVMGILEIASFFEFESYKINFIETLCASIGASLAMISSNDKTSRLLQESKEMSERLRSQEEELLQNTEELQATQEEMQRKLHSAERKISAIEKIVGKIEQDDAGRLVNEDAIYSALRGQD